MPITRNLAIVLFDDVELLDFCGPFEVFTTANRQGDGTAFNVYPVAETMKPIKTRNELSVLPRFSLSDCPHPDLLLVPGGIGARQQLHNDRLVQWIRHRAREAELVMSVCTGALLLAKAGLLEGLETTTHHAGFASLRELVPSATVHEDRRFVDTGKVITSAGIAAGIDMSLHIVQRLLGTDTAVATARHMEYPWTG